MIEIKSIQFKRGTAASLTAYLAGDNRLAAGEPAFEKDTGKLKIGTGEADYADLPYTDNDTRFIIHDPLEGQVLIYDSTIQKWVNKDLADSTSIIYLAEHGLTIKGYDTATSGQMLVKDAIAGLIWQDPVTVTELASYTTAAEESARTAGGYATQAGNKAIEADTSAKTAESINKQTMNWVNGKFWWGTMEEYNELESINPGTFYFITTTTN